MKTGIDPCVDYAFKRIFGSEDTKPVLMDLLRAVRPNDRPLVDLVLLNPFNDKDGADDKLSILDIKARDDQGQHYNVEMQLFGSKVHLHRLLYYWANLHGDQLRQGEDYPMLQPTISVAIVNTALFPDVPAHHQEFQIRGVEHPEVVFSSHLSIHLIELPKFNKASEELTALLDVWCYFLKHGGELDTDRLPQGLQTPTVRHAMEVLEMLSHSEIERERYKARLKWQRDETAFIKEALEIGKNEGRTQGHAEGRAEGRTEGRAEGRAEGRTEGRAEGRTEGRAEGVSEGFTRGVEKGVEQGIEKGKLVASVRFCQRLLKQPMTPEAELAGLTIEDLRLRASTLEKQASLPEI